MFCEKKCFTCERSFLRRFEEAYAPSDDSCCYFFDLELMPGNKVITGCAPYDNSANKNDKNMVEVLEKT